MSRRLLGPVRTFDEIDSTNRYLADEARSGASDGLVAIARYQSAGRGRLDRRWEAPAGANLLMSVLLRPEKGLEPFHFMVATALAASDACRGFAGVDPGLKWPNDLVVDGRLDPQPVEGPLTDQMVHEELKLAGILAELVSGPPGPPAVVVGLGLNVGWPAPEPQVPEMKGATSLSRLTGRPVDPEDLSEAVLDRLDLRLAGLLTPAGARTQIDEYRRHCVTLGRSVRVEEQSGTNRGYAKGITDQGHLVFESQGRTKEVTAGDVVHLGHVRFVARS